MPQNNVLPVWRADYPLLAPVQKPGGVTVATTATAPRVPNKFTYSAGTIQMVDFETGAMKFEAPVEPVAIPPAEAEEGPAEEAKVTTQEEAEEENMEEVEEEDDDGDGKPRRTTTRTTRTTTRRR
jgi:hypothetical protein